MMLIKSIFFLSLLCLLLFLEQASSVSENNVKLVLKGNVAQMGRAELNNLKALSLSQDFSNCLKPQIGDEQLDFTDPNLTLEDIITKYFNVYPDYIENDLDSRVAIFVENLKNTADIVAECVKQDPENQIRVGFTSRFGLDPSEYLIENITLTSEDKTKSCQTFWGLATPLPETFNWYDQGKVTKPKNQGKCDVCYIFAAIGCLESSYMITHDKSVDFSEQDVMNCVIPQSAKSCKVEGSSVQVFPVIQKRGLVSEKEVPYRNKLRPCEKHDKWLAHLQTWCYDNKMLTDEQLKTMVYTRGPVVVGINAKDRMFKGLTQKVYDKPCKDKKPNHDVLLIGWDPKHWIVKNSWDTSWGQNGFAWIKRSEPNMCGINQGVFAAWVI